MQGAQPKLFWNLLWHILYISDWIILNFHFLLSSDWDYLLR